MPPTAFSSAPPGLYVGDTGAHAATAGSSEELFAAQYNRNGISPIPFGIVAIAAMGVALWAYDWARWTPGDGERVASEWWINTTAVLLPGTGLTLAAVSDQRMWSALALLVFAGICTALWVGRIGSNLRLGDQPFGSILPIVAFPGWWMLAITIGATELVDSDPADLMGLTEQIGRDRSDLLMRALVAVAVILAQFVLLRWSTLNRIWRAGHLVADQVSLVLWIPMMIPWLLYFSSLSYTLIVVDDGDRLASSDWRPTQGMLDWAHWTTRGTWVAIVLLLIVVSVRQHQGLAHDRAADDAARAR